MTRRFVEALWLGLGFRVRGRVKVLLCNDMFDKFLVSKETIVLRLWRSETLKFVFRVRVDKGRITILKDLES